MAVTRTVAQLSADLRIGDGTAAPDGAVGVVLARIHATAVALIEAHAPDAPAAMQDEAFVRLAGWLYDSDPSGRLPGGPNALRASGAAALLSRWRSVRGVVISESGRQAVPDIGGPGLDAEARRLAREALAAVETETTARKQADAVIAEAAAENTGFLSTFAARVRAIVEAIVPAWARNANPPEPAGGGLPAGPPDGFEYQLTARGPANAVVRFWKRLNLVPDTPGEASGVGHVLTATGEGDRDYAWRAAPGSGQTGQGGLNQAQVDARVEAGTEDWAHRDSEDTIPADKTFAPLFTVAGEEPIARGNLDIVVSQATLAGGQIVRAARTFPVSADQVRSGRAAILATFTASAVNIPGDPPQEIDVLLIQPDGTRQMHSITPTTGSPAGQVEFPVTQSGDYRWAIAVVTLATYGATFTMSRTRIGGVFPPAEAAVEDFVGERLAGKQDKLIPRQLIDLRQFDVIPGVVLGFTTDGQAADWLTDWRVWVSGGQFVGDVWLEMSIEGLATLAAPAPSTPGASLHRHKLSAVSIYNFTLSNSNRANLISGRSGRRQGRDIEIGLRFFDANAGGNLLDLKTIAVDWLPQPESAPPKPKAWQDLTTIATAQWANIVTDAGRNDVTDNKFRYVSKFGSSGTAASRRVVIPDGADEIRLYAAGSLYGVARYADLPVVAYDASGSFTGVTIPFRRGDFTATNKSNYYLKVARTSTGELMAAMTADGAGRYNGGQLNLAVAWR